MSNKKTITNLPTPSGPIPLATREAERIVNGMRKSFPLVKEIKSDNCHSKLEFREY